MKRLLSIASLALLGCGGSAKPMLSPTPTLQEKLPVAGGRESWTSDRTGFAVGDVILVLIDELTIAEANTKNNASDTRRNSLTSQLAAAIKGTELPGAGVDISSNKSADLAKSGDASRRNRFTSQMSVRVLGFSTSGQLYVRGQKVVSLDNHQQAIQLSGWVRTTDVSSQNSVLSSRIGDAELIYAGNGSLDNAPSGLLTRVLGKVLP